MRINILILSFLFLTMFACEEPTTATDNKLPVLTASSIAVEELDVNQDINIEVTLDKASTQEIIVNYSTIDGTAVSNEDYISLQSKTLVFAVGETSKIINVTIIGDVFKEPSESFTLSLSSAINGSIATPNIEISISDTDTEVPSNDYVLPATGYSTPLSYAGYDLVWQDEFNAGQVSDNWTFEIGTGNNGWGNNELQYYRKENTFIKEGSMVIEARKESFGGKAYTSSRIVSRGKAEFQYGRIDIRAVLPKGQGIWPALWMLGSNFTNVGWPYCGEIDIMEMIGGQGREKEVFGTLHWDNGGSYACTCGQGDPYTLSNGTFADEFHVFSIIWDENKIEWLVDDNSFKVVDISPTDLSEFREKFFFILNIAVGGNLPGSPNETTILPQRMAIDYIRVFQKP